MRYFLGYLFAACWLIIVPILFVSFVCLLAEVITIALNYFGFTLTKIAAIFVVSFLLFFVLNTFGELFF